MTFALGACVNDREKLHADLLASPELSAAATDGTGRRVVLVEGMPSAAEGIEVIRSFCDGPVIVAHQDVWFPDGALAEIERQWRYQQAVHRGWVMAMGVAGVTADRRLCLDVRQLNTRFRSGADDGPVRVRSLDEVVLVIAPQVPPLDPGLGWHLYGTDLCFRAEAAGGIAVCAPVPIEHRTVDYAAMARPDFRASARRLAQQWPDRMPVRTTTCTVGENL